jgi:hypothetical protein
MMEGYVDDCHFVFSFYVNFLGVLIKGEDPRAVQCRLTGPISMPSVRG